jgi:GNAT superfamily N-acetyltransferase
MIFYQGKVFKRLVNISLMINDNKRIDNLVVRKANLNDAPKLSYLYKTVWDEQKGKFPDELLHARQPDENKMKQWLCKETYFMVEDTKKTIGVVGCFMKFGCCKLIHMAVLKNYRGKGIGSALLAKVYEFAKKNNAHKIWLDTSSRLKDSISFYQKAGFRLVGELKKHFWGEDIVLFEKLL